MMATPATCNQERYHDLLDRLDARRQVTNVPCMGLVERVDRGICVLRVFPMCWRSCWALSRGSALTALCWAAPTIPLYAVQLRTMPGRISRGPAKLYDGHLGTVRQLARVLEREGLLSGGPGGRVDFYTSGDQERILPTFRRLMEVYQTGLGAE